MCTICNQFWKSLAKIPKPIANIVHKTTYFYCNTLDHIETKLKIRDLSWKMVSTQENIAISKLDLNHSWHYRITEASKYSMICGQVEVGQSPGRSFNGLSWKHTTQHRVSVFNQSLYLIYSALLPGMVITGQNKCKLKTLLF